MLQFVIFKEAAKIFVMEADDTNNISHEVSSSKIYYFLLICFLNFFKNRDLYCMISHIILIFHFV